MAKCAKCGAIKSSVQTCPKCGGWNNAPEQDKTKK